MIIRFPSKRSLAIWSEVRRERRKRPRVRKTAVQVAEEKGISAAAISQFLKDANMRILDMFEQLAETMKAKITHISSEEGLAIGKMNYCEGQLVFFTYSAINGLNIWYEEELDANCSECERFNRCVEVIRIEYKERGMIEASMSQTNPDEKRYPSPVMGSFLPGANLYSLINDVKNRLNW